MQTLLATSKELARCARACTQTLSGLVKAKKEFLEHKTMALSLFAQGRVHQEEGCSGPRHPSC